MRLEQQLRVQTALQQRPHSYAELADLIGATRSTMALHCKKLRQLKVAHIAAWAPGVDGRHMVILLKWGHGVDAVRPEPKTAIQRAIASRARRKGSK